MPINSLVTTNTFRDWFNKTNEIIGVLNANTLVDGAIGTGAFTVNGSLLVVNTFFANSSAVRLSGNTTFLANVSVGANCNVWNFASGSLVIQPLNGTVVNTAITVNAFATFNGQVTFNANVSFAGDISEIGNTLINGSLSVNGPSIFRNVLFASNNSIAANTLSSPQYDDFAPTGLQEAQILNLTPNIDTVITGIAQPNTFVTGSRSIFIQNLSSTNKITFVSANTSSQLNNRIKTTNDISLDLLPGGAVEFVWNSTNKEWRPLSPQTSVLPSLTVQGLSTLNGNVIVGGWLNVAHQVVVAGNASITGNTTMTGFANIASTLQVAGLTTLTGNVTFGGYANVGTTLQVAGITTLNANVIMNGARAFANGQLRCDTTNGRFVLPVGTNLWAT